MFRKMTRTERRTFDKLRIGHTAWSPHGRGTAFLVPGKGVVGQQSRVRVSTLDNLVMLGKIETYGEFLHDQYWRYRQL